MISIMAFLMGVGISTIAYLLVQKHEDMDRERKYQESVQRYWRMGNDDGYRTAKHDARGILNTQGIPAKGISELNNFERQMMSWAFNIPSMQEKITDMNAKKIAEDVLLTRARDNEPIWGFYWDNKTVGLHKVYEIKYDKERGSDWQIMLTLGHGNFEWYKPEEYGKKWAFTLAEMIGDEEWSRKAVRIDDNT